MNENVKRLLTPITPDQPCGPDLSNDPAYDALVILCQGKPEVAMGTVVRPAEPPDWKALRKTSADFLEKKSKHLGVALFYCCSSLVLDGIAGCRDGLQLMQALLQENWAGFYPRLDPEDSNDPTQRLNILRTLTATPGSQGTADSWIKYTDYLTDCPIAQAKGEPPITFGQVMQSRSKSPGAPDFAKLTSAIANGGTENLEASRLAIQEAIDALAGIDSFLTGTLGPRGAISFEILRDMLRNMLQSVQAFISGDPSGAAMPADGGPAAGPAAASVVRGEIKTRQDVVQTIENICRYYNQVEPGSPVPYLLRRAQKMVHMNFVEMVQELNIAPMDALRPSMGGAAVPETPGGGS